MPIHTISASMPYGSKNAPMTQEEQSGLVSVADRLSRLDVSNVAATALKTPKAGEQPEFGAPQAKRIRKASLFPTPAPLHLRAQQPRQEPAPMAEPMPPLIRLSVSEPMPPLMFRPTPEPIPSAQRTILWTLEEATRKHKTKTSNSSKSTTTGDITATNIPS